MGSNKTFTLFLISLSFTIGGFFLNFYVDPTLGDSVSAVGISLFVILFLL